MSNIAEFQSTLTQVRDHIRKAEFTEATTKATALKRNYVTLTPADQSACKTLLWPIFYPENYNKTVGILAEIYLEQPDRYDKNNPVYIIRKFDKDKPGNFACTKALLSLAFNVFKPEEVLKILNQQTPHHYCPDVVDNWSSSVYHESSHTTLIQLTYAFLYSNNTSVSNFYDWLKGRLVEHFTPAQLIDFLLSPSKLEFFNGKTIQAGFVEQATLTTSSSSPISIGLVYDQVFMLDYGFPCPKYNRELRAYLYGARAISNIPSITAAKTESLHLHEFIELFYQSVLKAYGKSNYEGIIEAMSDYKYQLKVYGALWYAILRNLRRHCKEGKKHPDHTIQYMNGINAVILAAWQCGTTEDFVGLLEAYTRLPQESDIPVFYFSILKQPTLAKGEAWEPKITPKGGEAWEPKITPKGLAEGIVKYAWQLIQKGELDRAGEFLEIAAKDNASIGENPIAAYLELDTRYYGTGKAVDRFKRDHVEREPNSEAKRIVKNALSALTTYLVKNPEEIHSTKGPNLYDPSNHPVLYSWGPQTHGERSFAINREEVTSLSNQFSK